MKQGAVIRPWTLIEFVGEGGNAEVWLATRQGMTTPVAVKFLLQRKTTGERYRRFVQEIRALRELGPMPGVLPLLDSNLPAQPSGADPAWLSMPRAVPIREALAGASLETVVGAMSEIAATLTALAARGISHRDIKPGNLYRYDDHWVIGDFGLVALPDGEALTGNGRRLGPEHYTPYEFVIDPAGADPKPADVYMLAKTLWVVATSEEYPPSGHQRADADDGLRIADLRPHRHADGLDHLVDRSTLRRPRSRPTMQQVHADLEAWRGLRVAPDELDVSDMLASVRAKLRAEVEAENTSAERRRMAQRAAERLRERCAPLNRALRLLDARAEVNAFGHSLSGLVHEVQTMGSGKVERIDDRFGSLRSGPREWAYTVTYGWGVDLREDGTLLIKALVFVGNEGTIGSEFWWDERREAPVGSIEADRDIDELVDAIGPQLRRALEVFNEHLGA